VPVRDEEVSEQPAEPPPVIGDRLAHGMRRVRVLGGGVDERTPPVVGLLADFVHDVEDRQDHLARRSGREASRPRPLDLALLLHARPDEVVLAGEVMVEGGLRDARLGDDAILAALGWSLASSPLALLGAAALLPTSM
jgi:hypothetical protein